MTDQLSNAVQQPLQPQLELEDWCRSTGSGRALREGWQKGASGTLTQRLATLYLKKILEIYEKAKHSPGRQRHIWDLIPDAKTVAPVALEALAYVLGNLNEERSFNQVCATIGQRSEYTLWLNHPMWGKSMHLQGLKLASNNDLGMSFIRRRLKDKGFRKAAEYKELTHVERVALGAFFVEAIAESTRMIEIDVICRRNRKRKVIRYAPMYWDFLKRWKDATALFRSLFLPMVAPPRPWTAHSEGGYLTIGTTLSTVGWERWPEVSKHMTPCVIGSINLLQAQAYQLDHVQAALLEACWNLGHRIGGVPCRERIPEPNNAECKARGLTPSEYWKEVWKHRSDRRLDGARSRLINGLISYHRIEEADRIWLVWHMDHRGRLYSKGAGLNPQGPDHFRSLFRFAERSPIKGHEPAFAWSLGEAVGLPPDPSARLEYLDQMSEVIARAGSDPLGSVAFWEGAKEPWRTVQLCGDWFHYLQDPGYCSGTIHWLDQTCSGWGHVACLTRDGVLARYTNITGSRPADLYQGVGLLVEQRIKWLAQNHEDPEGNIARCLRWWQRHQIPRSLWKKVLMPVIYGRSYATLAEHVKLYLRDEVGDFLADEGLRVIQLALVLSTVVNDVVKEALPNVRDLSKWLTKLSNMQIDAGLRPYWFTPNGMAVECYQTETKIDQIELALSRRTIKVSIRDSTGCAPDKQRTARKLVPDFIHSMDAAFLQRFVAHWGTYQHPISVVHDCFGTTLEHVGTLQSELQDQWHRFYSVDHLCKHQAMVSALLGKPVPLPPHVGTLDPRQIGENPFLFC